MFAFATAEAIQSTRETGRATFWSRSRGELWEKGRTSGNEIRVLRVLVDCDADCVIYSSEPHGNSCHTGAPSCFFQALEGEAGETLEQAAEQPQTLLATLESVLEARKKSTGEASYTKSLYDAGAPADRREAPRGGGRGRPGPRERERRARRQRGGRRALSPAGRPALARDPAAPRLRRAGAPPRHERPRRKGVSPPRPVSGVVRSQDRVLRSAARGAFCSRATGTKSSTRRPAGGRRASGGWDAHRAGPDARCART